MEKFTVSENVEIIVDGQRILLESGDVIMVEYVRGPKYNEVKQHTDIDTSVFVNDNIESLMASNPSIRVGDVTEAFIGSHPDYLTDGEMAEQLSPEEIKKKLHYSIQVALKKKGLYPDPIRPGGGRRPRREVPQASRPSIGVKKRIRPTV